MSIYYLRNHEYECVHNLILLPRLREIEERLHGLKASSMTQTPALKFKVRKDRSDFHCSSQFFVKHHLKHDIRDQMKS